jgi:hypothetical protein
VEHLEICLSPIVPVQKTDWKELKRGLEKRTFAPLEDLEGGRYVALRGSAHPSPQKTKWLELPRVRGERTFAPWKDLEGGRVATLPMARKKKKLIPSLWLNPKVWGPAIGDFNRLVEELKVPEDVKFWIAAHERTELDADVPYEVVLIRPVIATPRAGFGSRGQFSLKSTGELILQMGKAVYDLGNLNPARYLEEVKQSFLQDLKEFPEPVGIPVHGLLPVQEMSDVE